MHIQWALADQWLSLLSAPPTSAIQSTAANCRGMLQQHQFTALYIANHWWCGGTMSGDVEICDSRIAGSIPVEQCYMVIIIITTRAINVSEITAHCSGMTQNSQGKQHCKRWVFIRLQNVDRDGADVTCCGRPFQTWVAAMRKALSPTVDRSVQRTTSDNDDDERRRHGAL